MGALSIICLIIAVILLITPTWLANEIIHRIFDK
jgi:hypothetical protein